jgi:hypothetical protein
MARRQKTKADRPIRCQRFGTACVVPTGCRDHLAELSQNLVAAEARLIRMRAVRQGLIREQFLYPVTRLPLPWEDIGTSS